MGRKFMLLIKNGLVVGETGSARADVRAEGEIIAEIGGSLVPRDGEQVIDASGMIVIPGGVDAHTHMDLDLGSVRATDDFFTGTAAAACGGTTTIVDHMAFGPRGCSIKRQLDAYHGLAEGKAVVDYSFHGVLDHVDDAILEEVESLIGEGITSHKIYMTYDGKVTDDEIAKLFERTSELGVLVAVHAENDRAIAHLREKLLAQGKTAPAFHAKSRPPVCESEAVGRVAEIARELGDAPLYIVHLSSYYGLIAVEGARAREQKNLFVETCPQYLFLDESLYKGEDALKYTMSPPLRGRIDCKHLWGAVSDGGVDVVATDHCPFYYSKEKQLGKDDFTKAPGGIPGVEARIPLMFSATREGKLSPERFVSLCCANPARLFGLYPKKGVIAVGSDADIVIIDPGFEGTLTHGMLHENCDYTPYEGLPLRGYPIMTISRGEVIARDGLFTGSKGRGRFLRRDAPIPAH